MRYRPRKSRRLDIPQGGHPLPNATRLVRASNDFIVAGAIWERRDGHWLCIKAAPALGWMHKLTPALAKLELAKRGYSWEWL